MRSLVILLAFLFVAESQAQENIPVGREFALSRLHGSQQVSLYVGAQCGEFFSTSVVAKNRMVIFMVIDSPDSILLGVMSRRRVRTVIDGRKAIPTVTNVRYRTRGLITEVRLSQSEFGKAKLCLPEP